MLLRRPRVDDGAAQSQILALSSDNQKKELDLRQALAGVEKFSALADERKSETARLNGDLSELRTKIEHDGEERTKLSNTISRMDAEMTSQKAAAAEKIEMLTKLREGMEGKFRELAQEALKVQGDAFAKMNLEKLDATLLPLKEHVGLFEKELRSVHKDSLKEREHLKAEIKMLS